MRTCNPRRTGYETWSEHAGRPGALSDVRARRGQHPRATTASSANLASKGGESERGARRAVESHQQPDERACTIVVLHGVGLRRIGRAAAQSADVWVSAVVCGSYGSRGDSSTCPPAIACLNRRHGRNWRSAAARLADST